MIERGGGASARRIAALYDVHGNLPALEAALGEVRRARVDAVVVGGDVLPGPMARESLDLLLELDLPVRFIRGNGEREVLARRRGEPSPRLPEAAQEAIRWSAAQLLPLHDRALSAWPETLTLELDELGPVLFCHATPQNDTDIFTRLSPAERVAGLFAGVEASLVVCGHTHMPFDRTVGRTRIVNAGSVGMPFGEPGASWLLLGPAVQPRHTGYDLEDAAARIRATTYPGAAGFAERYVLRPPSEAEMLDLFADERQP